MQRQLVELGVREGGVLLVHTSFRAVGPMEEGPRGLLRALRGALGPTGTLVMPTMTDGQTLFDPRTTPTTDMGIVAETFWRMDGVVRSTHPGGSFAAEGPHAVHICAPQPLSPPHGPVSPPGRVLDRSGQVLLLGVHHSESTMLHVAEAIAGVPYAIEHPTVVEVEPGVVGTVGIAETDHCCMGFRQLDPWLEARGLLRRGPVGNAEARLTAARDLVDVALEHLRTDPLVFLCEAGLGCEECDAARASCAAPPTAGS
ncbi:MAG: AAC(3) family N-acetyltransferase [Deltaproteobacteria bacterium]|nr:AAC(3) family N-acetyltransferase [Deltaproteobacteria bacterium]